MHEPMAPSISNSSKNVLSSHLLMSRYETLLVVFLIGTVLLFRDRFDSNFSELLYVLLGFLIFNFLYSRYLRQPGHYPGLEYSSVFINGLLITAAIQYSGGRASYFWVLYLLPIFNSCLVFHGRNIWVATGYSFFLMLSFYRYELWSLDGFGLMELLSRTTVLVLSTVVTAPLAQREEKNRHALFEKQKAYEKALGEHLHKKPIEQLPEREKLMARVLHEANIALSMVVGSSFAIQNRVGVSWEGMKDIHRIESAVFLNGLMLRNISVLGVDRKEDEKQIDLGLLLEDVERECRYEAFRHGVVLHVETALQKVFVTASELIVRQVFMNVFYFVFLTATSGAKIQVRLVAAQTSGICVSVEDDQVPPDEAGQKSLFKLSSHPLRSGGHGDVGLCLAREAMRRQGGDVFLTVAPHGGRRFVMVLPKMDSVQRHKDAA